MKNYPITQGGFGMITPENNAEGACIYIFQAPLNPLKRYQEFKTQYMGVNGIFCLPHQKFTLYDRIEIIEELLIFPDKSQLLFQKATDIPSGKVMKVSLIPLTGTEFAILKGS